MEKAKYIPSSIDGKEIQHDWIYELLGDHYMTTPLDRKNKMRQYIAYKVGVLIQVTWEEGGCNINFAVLKSSSSSDDSCLVSKIFDEVLDKIAVIEEGGSYLVTHKEYQCEQALDVWIYYKDQDAEESARRDERADVITNEILSYFFGDRFKECDNIEDDEEMNHAWEYFNDLIYNEL